MARAKSLDDVKLSEAPRARFIQRFRDAVTSTQSKSIDLPRWSHCASMFQRPSRLRRSSRARRSRPPMPRDWRKRRRFSASCQINFDTRKRATRAVDSLSNLDDDLAERAAVEMVERGGQIG